MLSLRSACLEISYADGSYTFTVRGWGHGVGMSQAGAVFLARQGADYREISIIITLAYPFPYDPEWTSSCGKGIAIFSLSKASFTLSCME